jgi:hypothetical protein
VAAHSCAVGPVPPAARHQQATRGQQWLMWVLLMWRVPMALLARHAMEGLSEGQGGVQDSPARRRWSWSS